MNNSKTKSATEKVRVFLGYSFLLTVAITAAGILSFTFGQLIVEILFFLSGSEIDEIPKRVLLVARLILFIPTVILFISAVINDHVYTFKKLRCKVLRIFYRKRRVAVVSHKKEDRNEEEQNKEIGTQIVEYEKEVGDIMTLFEGAVEHKSMWENYKHNKHVSKATENLQVLKQMLDSFTEVSNSAAKASEAKQALERNELARKRLSEIVNKEQDLEIAKLDAEKAHYDEKKAVSTSGINKVQSPPPPITLKSREDNQAERQEKREEDEDRKEVKVKEWRRELLEDPNFRNEDIETEIERKKRARGWLERM